jgi:uncharacterized membrane protein YgcG
MMSRQRPVDADLRPQQRLEISIMQTLSNHRRSTSFRTRAGFGLLALTGLIAACVGGPDDLTDADPTARSQQSLEESEVMALAQAIFTHPAYDALSSEVTTTMTQAVLAVAGMEGAQVQGLLDELAGCTEGQIPCDGAVAALGIQPSESAYDLAGQIWMDLGLEGQSEEKVTAAFRYAQMLEDGSYAGSSLLGALAAAIPASCNGGCLTSVAAAAGEGKADMMAALAKERPGQGSSSSSTTGGAGANNGSGGSNNGGGGANSGGSNGGGGVTPGKVEGWVKALEKLWELLKKIEDDIWNSDEEDKACHEDVPDCPPDQYCHKLGDNDCRSDKLEGSLCSRDTQCATDCCKHHISALGLKICRPASKCSP